MNNDFIKTFGIAFFILALFQISCGKRVSIDALKLDLLLPIHWVDLQPLENSALLFTDIIEGAI